MFDTHCHLNFGAFNSSLGDVVARAHRVGVFNIVIPGTDVATSKKAIEIAKKNVILDLIENLDPRFHEDNNLTVKQFNNVNLYAAVGIHPHHVFELLSQKLKVKNQNYKSKIKNDLNEIEKFLKEKKVIAVGEVGLDRHYYLKTKYQNYEVNEAFVELQSHVLRAQILLSIKYDKSLILHNREAKADMLPLLNEVWDTKLEGVAVFHCCEPDEELLTFAKEHKMFIGIDGDVTYRKDKQEFIKKVPLEMIVLETDSPFLTPKIPTAPVGNSGRLRPINEPKNLELISKFIANLRKESTETFRQATTENAKKLFRIDSEI